MVQLHNVDSAVTYVSYNVKSLATRRRRPLVKFITLLNVVQPGNNLAAIISSNNIQVSKDVNIGNISNATRALLRKGTRA
jgi:hypothetical protein